VPTLPGKVPAREIVILIFDGVQPIDFSGPAQALTTANEEGASPPYAVRLHAMSQEKVRTASGFFVSSEPLPKGLPIDTLIIPGGPGVHEASHQGPLFSDALRKLSDEARRVCSVCTGAFLLARTGLLAQRRAVTHWRSCDRLAQEFPEIRVEPDSLFLKDGNVWTSAGVTAGIDLTLALIQEDHSAALAAKVARRLVVYLRRPGGQKQYSEPLSLQEAAGTRYAGLLQKMLGAPELEWHVEEMASVAGQSLRSFHRGFQSELGMTPSKALEKIRTEQARNYLHTTDLRLKQIAGKCGFRTEDAMREAMVRQFGVSPSEIRERFSL
jgi:transcriptional regulator GlxA family with amidase domain